MVNSEQLGIILVDMLTFTTNSINLIQLNQPITNFKNYITLEKIFTTE
ncbi:MAG: hypothetical protein JWR02_649 [Mucilaginibacter sp.]|nr:hypothetical protein [Mucilaginibacter sp.]